MNVIAMPTPEGDDPRDRQIASLQARLVRVEAQLSSERERIKSVIVDLENAEISLRVERRARANAESKLKQMRDDEMAPEIGRIREVFEYWRDQCRAGSKRVVLGEKRSAVIAARLKDGYSVDDLCRAIDGAVVGAFEKDGRRYDEIELIMRNEVKVDDFIQRAGGDGPSAAAAPPPRPRDLSPPTDAQVQRRMDVQRLIDALVDHWGLDACIPDHIRDQELWPCPKCTPRDQVGKLYPLTIHLNAGQLAHCSGCGVTGEQLLGAIE